MATISVLLMAIAMAGAMLLVASGSSHLRDRRRLHAALVSQALLPYRWLKVVAVAVIVVELGLGAATLVLGGFFASKAAPLLAAEAGLYLTFVAYSGALWLRKSSAPCGCFAGDGPVTRLVLVRNALLALAAAGGAVLEAWTPQLTRPPLLLLVAGAAAIAVLVRVTPVAFARPPGARGV